MRPPIRFTEDDAQAAWEAWRFNCGPGALCAITGMTPAELRPHLGDFENAACVGGWISWKEWATQLVPWLLKECHPKATGGWWPTHCWEVPRPSAEVVPIIAALVPELRDSMKHQGGS